MDAVAHNTTSISTKKPTLYQLSREYGEVAEVTSVATVTKGLAQSAVAAGFQTAVFLPCYGFLTNVLRNLEKFGECSFLLLDKEETVVFWRTQVDSVTLYLLENHYFADKDAVYTYVNHPLHAPGEPHTNTEEMNMVLQKGALELAKLLGPPDVFHAHDGHTAFLSVLASEDENYKNHFFKTKFVLTLHNVAVGHHQEIAGVHKAQALTELSASVLKKGVIAGDTVDPLALAAHYSFLTTTSPEFANDLLSEENSILFGNLGDYLKQHNIHPVGIHSGVDFPHMDPRKATKAFPLLLDPSDANVREKNMYRDYLVMLTHDTLPDLTRYGYLESNEKMCVIALSSDISYIKGFDYTCNILKVLMDEFEDLCVVIMGKGEPILEYKLIAISKHPRFYGRFVYWQGHSNEVQRVLLSGAQFLLSPSIYEPSATIDLYAQVYGCLPIVHATGGFKKVINEVTGFTFGPLELSEYYKAVKHALAMYYESPSQIYEMVSQAFKNVEENFSWDHIFSKYYVPFYQQCLEGNIDRGEAL